MTNSFLLEITVESVEAAFAAECGGADRVELCADLPSGGLTPTFELMHNARAALRLPIFVMVRPRPGNFSYNDDELALMKSQIIQARKLGMNGIVLGILHENKTVDIARLKSLVESARPLPVTFHRAFDDTPDPYRALETVISAGAARILTAGGTLRAPDSLGILSGLVKSAGQRVVVMPGGGIRAENISLVKNATNAREFHSGLGSVLPYGSTDFARFEEEVRRLAEQKCTLV
jgi:copper homeostasis protein